MLKIREANHIILNEGSTVNFKKDAKQVSPVFYNLIKTKMQGKKTLKRKSNNVATLNETSTLSEPINESDERIEHMFRHFDI